MAGTTLAFELISDKDPQVQLRRGNENLHLFYAVDHATGRIFAHDEVIRLANSLGICPVKQQTMSKTKFMQLLRKMDEVDACADVREGVVVIDEHLNRLKVKSWLYLSLSNQVPRVTPRWFANEVMRMKSMDQLHECVESVQGILDTSVSAHRLLVDALSAAAQFLKGIPTVADSEEIERHDERIRPFLRTSLEDPLHFPESDQALLFALRHVVQRLAPPVP